ncbi:PrsW family intramembrane metalloprotease [Amycolatopsis sp. CA-230715]|uniref:PrsW family intramembrane metalloprotease n=1 Tax=Amycolatopsis sp. CA-230715 TaxID=2745196 RepID=UPI001C02278C|nr:PrsW family intramembrane metalloprotease [Amycolatopsis sp. CA-230715]
MTAVLRRGGFAVRTTAAVWLATVVLATACLLLFPWWRGQLLMSFPGDRYPTPGGMAATYLIGMAVGTGCGAALLVTGPAVIARFARDGERARKLVAANRCAALVCATGMPVFPFAKVFLVNPAGTAMAVPGAVFAVWVLHRLPRFRRIPLRFSLLAFGWGVTFAFTFGCLAQTAHSALALRSLSDDWVPADLGAQPASMVLAAPLWEECAKAAGVLVVFHLLRRRFDGVLTGAVLGGMTGAGFNFAETARFAMANFDQAAFHVWVRQWAGGVLFGHVLFTGLFGAAVGLASRYGGWAGRVVCVAAGFATAVLGHFFWNFASFNGGMPWHGGSQEAEVLLAMPLNYATLSGPLLVVVGVALWLGARHEARALRAVLLVESATGLGAVTRAELPVLSHPRLRIAERLRACQRYGVRGYVHFGRLRDRQLELAATRWRLARDPDPRPPASERALRTEISALRQRCTGEGLTCSGG